MFSFNFPSFYEFFSLKRYMTCLCSEQFYFSNILTANDPHKLHHAKILFLFSQPSLDGFSSFFFCSLLLFILLQIIYNFHTSSPYFGWFVICMLKFASPLFCHLHFATYLKNYCMDFQTVFNFEFCIKFPFE